MEKNENKKIKIFSNLKQQKILELQEKINKGKSVNEKKEKINRNLKELVIHTKESENRKKKKKKKYKFFYIYNIHSNVTSHSFPILQI